MAGYVCVAPIFEILYSVMAIVVGFYRQYVLFGRFCTHIKTLPNSPTQVNKKPTPQKEGWAANVLLLCFYSDTFDAAGAVNARSTTYKVSSTAAAGKVPAVATV